MYVYNMASRSPQAYHKKTKFPEDNPYFIICSPKELIGFQPHFHFDEETIVDCLYYDENIRFNSYDDYDFISWLYFWLDDTSLKTCEMNLYVSKHFLVFVMPEAVEAESLRTITDELIKKIEALPPGPEQMNKAYYTVFDMILSNFSRTLEAAEDRLYEIETQLSHVPNKQHLKMITHMKNMVYRIRKQIRPLLYIGDQFIVNENNFIHKENMRYFKNLDVRINKLFDFATSLQEFANQILYAYDSRVTMQTNEIVNKLTIITIFFGPMTIVTGIYGMNFDVMPELDWIYGYPLALFIMALISLIIFIVLKRKKWL